MREPLEMDNEYFRRLVDFHLLRRLHVVFTLVAVPHVRA